MQIMHQNIEKAQMTVKAFVSRMQEERTCPCGTAADHAIVTDKDAIPAKLKEEFSVLFGKSL